MHRVKKLSNLKRMHKTYKARILNVMFALFVFALYALSSAAAFPIIGAYANTTIDVRNATYTTSAQNIQRENEKLQRIFPVFSQYAEKARQDWGAPGMAIAIVKDNSIVYAQGFGVRNTQGDRVTPQTIFGIGSLTKSFTVALLAKLIEEKKFTWNSKVCDLIPSFKLYDFKVTRAFTVGDLMAHHSGLPGYAGEWEIMLGYDKEYVLHSLQVIKPVSNFRTKFAYQNIFSLVAEKIVEKYTQKNYAENVQAMFFAPLNMQHSSAQQATLVARTHDIATPFINNHGTIMSIPRDWPYAYWIQNYASAGGIYSSAVDMAHWLLLHINGGVIKGEQILSKDSIAFMRSPQTIQKRNVAGKIVSYHGEGWFYQDDYAPYSMLFHDGDATGMLAGMAYIPEARLGIVVLTNFRPSQLPQVLRKKFFDLYFDRPEIDWSKKALKEQQREDKRNYDKIKLLRCNLDGAKNINFNSDSNSISASSTSTSTLPTKYNFSDYVGIYSNNIYGKVRVAATPDHLTMTIGPKNIRWNFLPCNSSKDIFKIVWRGGIPEFSPNSAVETFMLVKFIRDKNIAKNTAKNAKNNARISMRNKVCANANTQYNAGYNVAHSAHDVRDDVSTMEIMLLNRIDGSGTFIKEKI